MERPAPSLPYNAPRASGRTCKGTTLSCSTEWPVPLRLIGSLPSGEDTDVCDGWGEPILLAESTYMGCRTDQYRFIPSSYIRLLRYVGIKVADE